MDKNNTYLAIGGTAVVALLVIVGMVLASGYAGTLTGMAAGTQTSLDSVSGRLNALKTETDQLNSTASLNLIRTEAIIPALNEAAGDLSDEIASGNTNLQNSLDSVNSSIVNELNSVKNDLSGSLDAVNSSLYNQMNTANANITNQLNLINTGLSNQLTTVYNNLHSELSLAYSGIISSVNAMNTNINAQFSNLNANLSAVNASIISAINANNASTADAITAVNASIIDQLVAMNMSVQDALALLQGNVTDLEQKLWSMDSSVKNDTKLIQGLVDNITSMNSTIQSMLADINSQTSGAPQVLTKSGTFTLLNQTTVPDGEEYVFIDIAMVAINGDGAGDFKATALVWIDNASRDISDADNDYFMMLKSVGSPEVTSIAASGADGEIGLEWFEIEFTGHSMSIYFVLRGTVQEDITVYYSYTVTTSNDQTITNYNPDPPVP